MSFDRVAPVYRTLETVAFGEALQRARVRWIGDLPTRARALVVGEGNGRFVVELVRAHPGLTIHCVDQSGRMLALARQRVNREVPQAAIRFIRADVLEWEPSDPYDLIVTHFFLDCFDAAGASAVVEKLTRSSTPNAVWLLADFQVPAERWRKLYAKLWLRAMYLFFGLTAGLKTRALVDATPFLEKGGFVCRQREVTRAGMLKSEMWVREG